MNWTQVRKIYAGEAAYLKPIEKERAMLEYNYLTASLTACLPQAIDDPGIIASTDLKVTAKILQSSTFAGNLLFRRSGDALKKVHHIMQKHKYLPAMHDGLNARNKALTREQVIYCFAEFLKKNDIHNISTSLYNKCEADVIAQKEDIHIFALAISSPVRNTGSAIKTKESKTIFKTNFGLSLLVLFDKMTADPSITAALLISDDMASRELIVHYQHILKTGIKIFLVTSADKVEMLEADL